MAIRGLFVFLLAACLVASCAAVEVQKSKHGKHHNHHHKRHHAKAEVPVIPPFGFPLPGAAVPPGSTESADMFRFATEQLGLKTPDSGATTPVKSDIDKDIVRSVYNLLSKGRDINVEDTSKLQREKQQNQRKWRELEDKAKLLRSRSEMLARLEFCLQQDSKRNTTVVDAANTTSIAAAQNALIAKKEQEITNRATQLDSKEKDLIAREAALRVRLDDLQKAELALKQKENGFLAAAQGVNTTQTQTKVEYIKVPKIVYKKAPEGCEAITECGSCTASPSCGWCEATKKCHTSTNGTSDKCDAASWSYMFCKGQSCDKHLHCASCMADPRCGMCASTGTCQPGHLTGPNSGSCPMWNYAVDMRFLSYNVYGKDMRNATGRASWLFKMIQQADADFIALQEVEDWFIDALSKERWALNYHMSDYGSGHAPGGLLILSKLPLESVSYYEKTDPGQIEVDQRARMLTVRPKIGSRNLVIATTALDWRNANNRAASLDFVFSVLNDTQDVVLSGDFNFDAYALPESQHVPARYTDVWNKVHPTMKGYTWDPTQNSYAKASDPTSQPSRIDRMYVRSGYWQSSKIDKIGCPEASPHYGLLAEFSLFAAYC